MGIIFSFFGYHELWSIICEKRGVQNFVVRNIKPNPLFELLDKDTIERGIIPYLYIKISHFWEQVAYSFWYGYRRLFNQTYITVLVSWVYIEIYFG